MARVPCVVVLAVSLLPSCSALSAVGRADWPFHVPEIPIENIGNISEKVKEKLQEKLSDNSLTPLVGKAATEMTDGLAKLQVEAQKMSDKLAEAISSWKSVQHVDANVSNNDTAHRVMYVEHLATLLDVPLNEMDKFIVHMNNPLTNLPEVLNQLGLHEVFTHANAAMTQSVRSLESYQETVSGIVDRVPTFNATDAESEQFKQLAQFKQALLGARGQMNPFLSNFNRTFATIKAGILGSVSEYLSEPQMAQVQGAFKKTDEGVLLLMETVGRSNDNFIKDLAAAMPPVPEEYSGASTFARGGTLLALALAMLGSMSW